MGWEVVNLNNTNSSMFIIFISILILNMLIIFFGIYTYFFNVSDYTLIAGIIGFCGAIIGGYLTWRGVEYNIEHQKAKDRYKKLPDEIKKCWKLNKYLSFGHFISSLTKELKIEDIRDKILQFYDDTEEDATEIALDISPEMYRLTMNYYTLLSEYVVYVKKNKIDDFNEEMSGIYNKSCLILQAYEKEYESLAESLNVKM